MRPNVVAALALVLGSLLLSAPASWAAVPKAKQAASATDVYKVAIDRSVSLAEAADSMRLVPMR